MRQTDNEIKSIIEGWTTDQLNNVYTALPGIVKEYDSAKNRAVVQPFGNYKATDGRQFPYPKIHNAPVFFPCGLGGKAGITYPVKSGDGCLIIFSMEQMEDFLSDGKSDNLDPRKHSINDAIVFAGLYSQAVQAQKTNSDDVCIFHSSAKLWLNDSEFCGNVGGTGFRFADGDLVVNGISLVHHTHTGVHGETSEPH